MQNQNQINTQPKHGFGTHKEVIQVKPTVTKEGVVKPQYPRLQNVGINKKPDVSTKVVMVDANKKIKEQRILKYGKFAITALLAEIDKLSDTNMDKIKQLVRENPEVKQYLKDVWYGLVKRASGKGMEIRLTKEQFIASLEVGKFALVSADKNAMNKPPEHKHKMRAYFNAKTRELKSDLINMGYLFASGLGKYGKSLEDSIIVMVQDGSEEDMTKLGEKYLQNSIIIHNGLTHFFKKTYGPLKGKVLNGKDYVLNNIHKKKDYTIIGTGVANQKFKFTLAFEDKPEFWRA